jgi:hypothetical protein
MRMAVARGLGMTICEGMRQASRMENLCGLVVERLEVVAGAVVVAAAVSRRSRIVDDRLEESDTSGIATEW